MKERIEDHKIIARIEHLARERKKIISLPAEEVLNAVLKSSQSTALVQSFSEEDFYFLIHHIGLEDAHPLLYLASDKQWEYMVDIEVWEKDRINLSAATKWFDLLFRIDPNRFIRWSLNQKVEFMAFYLYKNIEVKIRETDQDPSDFGDDFFTLDDIFYIRFSGEESEDERNGNESRETNEKHRDVFLFKFLKTLADIDHIIYQNMLMASSNVIPAECEEEVYRLRNGRLAEKGFMPHEEAVGIYQPMKVNDFMQQKMKFTTDDPDRKLFFPVPLSHTGILEEENNFTVALKGIPSVEVLNQIQAEFAGLCNRIISADQKNIRDRNELKPIVQKACGYLNMGLEKLAGENEEPAGNRFSSLIQHYPLINIFRVGFGLAMDLKWRAEKWLKTSWFNAKGLLLGFWGEEGMGVLGGLLIKKPLYFNTDNSGELYREFISVEDIKKTEKSLNEIMAFDEIFSLIAIEPESDTDEYLTYKNFVLTLWVRHHLGLAEKLLPLTLDEFRCFFDSLWADQKPPRKTSLSSKASLLDWLSDKTGLMHPEISQKLGPSLENLFNEMESEYGEVSRNDLDPRYIHLFLITVKNNGHQNG
ncbi:MAG: DUF6178 family protein [Desulfobacterales bacterium]